MLRYGFPSKTEELSTNANLLICNGRYLPGVRRNAQLEFHYRYLKLSLISAVLNFGFMPSDPHGSPPPILANNRP